MSDTSSPAATLRARIETQMTPAARYGLVVLALLLCIFGLRTLIGSVEALRAEAGRTAGDLALLSDSSAEETWASRLEEARAAQATWEGHIWTAASEGVGAAQLEVALRSLCNEAGVEKLQMNVSPEPLRRGELAFLRFSVSGEMPPGSFHSLVAGLGTARPDLLVTDVQLAQQKSGGVTIKLEGLAPFRAG